MGGELSLGMLSLDRSQPLTQLQDLPAEALHASGATLHDAFLQFRDLPAEALYASGATMHDTSLQLRDLPGEALHASGATMHDTSGHPIGSPYVPPEAGTGVITDYSV